MRFDVSFSLRHRCFEVNDRRSAASVVIPERFVYQDSYAKQIIATLDGGNDISSDEFRELRRRFLSTTDSANYTVDNEPVIS